MAESVNSLMEAICENLTRTMAEDKAVRENAEQQLAMLETNEEPFSIYVGMVYVFNLLLGTGVLALPAAFSKAGYVMGIILLAFLCFISYMQVAFLIEAMSIANFVSWMIQQEKGGDVTKLADHSTKGPIEGLKESKEASKNPSDPPTTDFEKSHLKEGYVAVYKSNAKSRSNLRTEDLESTENFKTPPEGLGGLDKILFLDFSKKEKKVDTLSNQTKDGETQALELLQPLEKQFNIVDRYEMGHMSELFLSPALHTCFFLSITAYLYGDLVVYNSVMAKSLREIACTSKNFTCGSGYKESPCWDLPKKSSYISRHNAYQLFVLAFNVVLIPIAYLKLQKTKAIQILTIILRFTAGLAMVGITLKIFAKKEATGKAVAVNWAEVPKLFGISIYAFMCHHSLPGMVTPVDKKKYIYGAVAFDFLMALSCYIVIAMTDYGLQLMQISMTESLDFSIRHLASVLLDRYISKHWDEHSDKFQPPMVTSRAKQSLREYLLKSLNLHFDGEEFEHRGRKLLSSYAHSVSKIAQHDWPAQWPTLFPTLVGYLGCGSNTAIYGVLKVFKELAHEVTDTQIPDVSPQLLPQMQAILLTPHHSVRTRANAVKIFGIIAETIMVMNEMQTNAVKLYLTEHIPPFMDTVIQMLATPEGVPEVDIILKKEIISVLTKFFRYCRKEMKGYSQQIFQQIWALLTRSALYYVSCKVAPEAGVEVNWSDSVDSDGESVGFESFVYTLVDFVNSAFEWAKYRALIKPVLSELLYYVLFFMQITEEQEDKWQSDLDQLLEEDDLDTNAYSVRIAAQDLVMSIAKEMTTVEEAHPRKDDEYFKQAFLEAINRHFREASSRKCHWQITESCLYALGILAPTIILSIKSSASCAEAYKGILDTVLSNASMSEPFLAGRSLWTASRFSPIMNDQSLDHLLQMTSRLLNTHEAPILRVYALRATYYFLENVQMSQKVALIKPYLNQFLQGLVSVGMQANSDTVFLVFQTIDLLLDLDLEFTASVSSSICTLATSGLLQYPDDPTIFEVVLSLLDRLFKLEQCSAEIQQRLLPIIVSILSGNASDPTLLGAGLTTGKITMLQPQVIDILTSLVNHCNQLNNILVQKVFPALVGCLSNASKEDSSIFQNGTECLRAYVLKGTEHLASLVDPNTNQNGVMLVFNVCLNVLGSQMSDSASLYVGRLIVSLILKANHLLGHDNIQHLLRSTLVRLNTAKEMLLTQSLILVFAHLIYLDLGTTLLFLHSLPAPDGTQSALVFVLDRWLGVQRYYCGYENKAAVVALCRLFQHSLLSSTEANSTAGSELSQVNLHRIEVTCEDEYEGSVRTRARTQTVTRKVPSTVKILKLLINEYIHIKELKNQQSGSDISDDESEEDESEDENFPDIHGDYGGKTPIDLTDLLTEGGFEDEDSDANEVLNEEIAQLDLENVLHTILAEFRRLPLADQFRQHLTSPETTVLAQL